MRKLRHSTSDIEIMAFNNDHISFHFRYLPRKTIMTKYFKNANIYIYIYVYWGPILGPFCTNLSENKFSWKKGLCQFSNIPIRYLLSCQKSEKNEPPLMKKLINAEHRKKLTNAIIWEIHGFPHKFPTVRENATKPMV